MNDVYIIGIDLAKNSFQLHGARADGSVAFRQKLGRNRLLTFLAEQPHCIVAMEACATAHGWGREIADLGHAVKLIPPQYVKPYCKRQKNDAADAEAIAEAASRPTMRFVEIKSSEQQARAMVFRTRQLFQSGSSVPSPHRGTLRMPRRSASFPRHAPPYSCLGVLRHTLFQGHGSVRVLF